MYKLDHISEDMDYGNHILKNSNTDSSVEKKDCDLSKYIFY
jgi:hypothetical protein